VDHGGQGADNWRGVERAFPLYYTFCSCTDMKGRNIPHNLILRASHTGPARDLLRQDMESVCRLRLCSLQRYPLSKIQLGAGPVPNPEIRDQVAGTALGIHCCRKTCLRASVTRHSFLVKGIFTCFIRYLHLRQMLLSLALPITMLRCNSQEGKCHRLLNQQIKDQTKQMKPT